MVDIETEVLQNLKCSVCQNYLSYSPIMQKANGDSVCGRCVTADNIEPSIFPMKAYEALASTHTFPCRYDKDGCSTKLHWEDVREHEEDCCYRHYECFMLPPGSCTWIGCRNQLMTHFTEDHPKNIMNISEETNIDVSQDFEMNILTIAFDLLFLVQIKYRKDANKMWHTVRYIGNEKCSMLFKYSCIVITEEEDIIKKRKVEPSNSLYALDDKSYEIDFEVLSECLKVAIKVNIDKNFEPKIQTRMECTLCKKCLNLHYTRQTKDGCYCAKCAPDNYIVISSSSFKVRCKQCGIEEFSEDIRKHEKWLCNRLRIYEEWYYISKVVSCNGLTWESRIYPQNNNSLEFVGILNGIFFIFTDFRATELHVTIVSRMKANEVEFFKCGIRVSNPATSYSVQTILKKGIDCDWESHFNWTPLNSLAQMQIENGRLKPRCYLKVTIEKVV